MTGEIDGDRAAAGPCAASILMRIAPDPWSQRKREGEKEKEEKG